jgi:hypothetical protein
MTQQILIFKSITVTIKQTNKKLLDKQIIIITH